MKLFLVRHGETAENINGITQGQYNSKLTKNGIDQVKKLALRLKDFTFDKIYSSDLKRAVKTTEEILQYHNIEPIYTSLLREQSKGIYEQSPKNRFNEGLKNSGESYWNFRPKNGENMVDVEKRVMEFYNQLDQNWNNVLLVAHGGSISALIMKLLNVEPSKLRDYVTKNTSVSILDIQNNSYNLDLLNCVKHLE